MQSSSLSVHQRPTTLHGSVHKYFILEKYHLCNLLLIREKEMSHFQLVYSN